MTLQPAGQGQASGTEGSITRGDGADDHADHCQSLAMIVLWAASMYLFKEKKNYWITAVPATFMSAVSCTYFVLAPSAWAR